MRPLYQILICLAMVMTYCRSSEKMASTTNIHNTDKGIMIAHLSDGNSNALNDIQDDFQKSNPGYTLNYFQHQKRINPSTSNRVIFIQSGSGTATSNTGQSSKFSIGDIIMLDPGESVTTDSLFSSLHVQVPSSAADDIPTFIRPDWDENITDIPGGCATETNAYRRILLTWKKEVGTYVYHALNSHRVRIMDSFSHYHPVEGGFDEFYLVQMALPEARIITSNNVSSITKPNQITRQQATELLDETSLDVGDLVYLPRGVMHRGMGGVLAQVITVPGFIPGAEIGVDHHLKRINDNLKLDGENIISYNVQASASAVIK